MNTHAVKGPVTSYHCSSDNVQVNVDHLVTAVAGLNNRILRLRKEIVAFKEESNIRLSTIRNSSRSASLAFNDSTKNVKEGIGARYELQRNFKGSDSLGGTDLSARLSFAKRAREVKAANEAAVFKEDYPRDDKSIEDDERPNRSRMSEPSRTYQKSISDAGKYGKEINERDVRTSRITDENLKNEVTSDTYGDCARRNVVIIPKIKRKRISRAVQYDISVGRQSQIGSRFLLNCFRPKSNGKKCNLVREIKKKEILQNKTTSETVQQKEGNISPTKEIINSDTRIEKHHNVFDKKIKKLLNNIDLGIEMSKDNEKTVKKITDTNDNRKQEENDDFKNHKAKKNPFKKLITILTRNNEPKTQQDLSQ